MAQWNDILGRSVTEDNVTNDDGSDSELDELKMRREGIDYVGTDATGRPMWEDERGQRLYYEDLPKKKGKKKKPNDNSGNNYPPGQGAYGYSGSDYSAYGKKDKGPSVINNPVNNPNNTVTPFEKNSTVNYSTYTAQKKSISDGVIFVFDRLGKFLGTWEKGLSTVYIAFAEYETLEELDSLVLLNGGVEIGRLVLGIYYDIQSFSNAYEMWAQKFQARFINSIPVATMRNPKAK